MNIGICELSYIPLRNGMSHKNEMLSQVLFGESFDILLSRNEWIKIKLHKDDYEGWIEKKDTLIIDNDSYLSDFLQSSFILEKTLQIKNSNNEAMLIPRGSRIPNEIIRSNSFNINKNKYFCDEDFIKDSYTEKREYIINKSLELLNTPYLWGGRTEWGIDCSGFTQLLYSLIGISLNRDAYQQIEQGETLNFISEAKRGDLAFFDNKDGRITHVGMIYDNGKIIHSSGKVRIDNIDHQGIYNNSQLGYTHNLRLVKSIISYEKQKKDCP